MKSSLEKVCDYHAGTNIYRGFFSLITWHRDSQFTKLRGKLRGKNGILRGNYVAKLANYAQLRGGTYHTGRLIIITSTTERRYYMCSGCYTYGMHDHVIPCLYPNRTFFVPKQDVFCTQTGRFLYPNRTFFSTLQNTRFYAIIMQFFAGME